MATFLFEGIVFGPIISRRLGISLGINLLPEGSKLCNFNCIYCECGWNRKDEDGKIKPFHSSGEVRQALETKLKEMKAEGNLPNAITFSGNGEPTMHPEFATIVDHTIALRDEYCPDALVCVLSNATLVHRPDVFAALQRVDRAILKLDSGYDETVRLIDNPQGEYSVAKAVEKLKAFNGTITVQTMFLRGTYNGQRVDNTSRREISRWLEVVREINPEEVTIYSIDRDTPAEGLEKVPREELEEIAERLRMLGYPVQVSG